MHAMRHRAALAEATGASLLCSNILSHLTLMFPLYQGA